ncbi:MAG: carbon-nitrogen hydrolase family protein [Eubacterium sp.]|nr:carbon-nitrogen hydrolase family protein [Eubacterium sp.]
MKLAMAQLPNKGSMDANLENCIKAIESAAASGADLILFPEVMLTEFFPQYPCGDARGYSLTVDSPYVQAVCEACRRHQIMAVPNYYLAEAGKTYDASLMISETGEIIGAQKMVHIARAPQFYEADYYTPADDGFKVFDTPFGKIGIVVCYDRHYPESIRTEALMGADLILVPTVNTKAEPSEKFEWEMKIQAFQNSVAIAMCNRVGTEGEMAFSGESMLIDANGETLCKADDRERIVYAEIDPAASRAIRDGKTYTQHRRPEFYV